MKIAVLNPDKGFLCGEQSMHRYADIFMQHYCDKEVTLDEAKNYKGDVIICFNGRPDLIENCPPKEFKGLKIAHVMDFVFNSFEANANLVYNNVQYLLGYADHWEYNDFFRNFYPSYAGKVIAVPFGFDRRFKNWNGERKQKCVGLGAINPVDEGIPDLFLYKQFYKHQKWSHPWRNTLRSKHAEGELYGIMDSYFPEYAKHGNKRFDYDIVDVFNTYAMFTTCESITTYPSVKTYEGMACGSVFVGNYHPVYKEVGLFDGYNCILHLPNDVEDFKRQIRKYLKNPSALSLIARTGEAHVLSKLSPESIAEYLFSRVTHLNNELCR